MNGFGFNKRKTIVSIVSMLILFILPESFMFAQFNTESAVTVKAKLLKRIAIMQIGGSLDFGEIVLNGTAQSASINSETGVSFQIAGQPGREVTISFENTYLNNYNWANNFGGIGDELNFTPEVVHTGVNSSYSNPISVISGEAYTLQNVSGNGYLYIWAGGALALNNDQQQGDYEGVFSVTVAY